MLWLSVAGAQVAWGLSVAADRPFVSAPLSALRGLGSQDPVGAACCLASKRSPRAGRLPGAVVPLGSSGRATERGTNHTRSFSFFDNHHGSSEVPRHYGDNGGATLEPRRAAGPALRPPRRQSSQAIDSARIDKLPGSCPVFDNAARSGSASSSSRTERKRLFVQ